MTRTAFLAIRALTVVWGLLELNGFLFFLSSSRGWLYNLYLAAPSVALLLAGLLPERALDRSGVKLTVTLVAIAGMSRLLHSMATNLSFASGGDIGAAMIKMIGFVLLVIFVIKMARMSVLTPSKEK